MTPTSPPTTFKFDFKAIAVICAISCLFFSTITVIIVVRLIVEKFFFVIPHLPFTAGYFFGALGFGSGAYFSWKRYKKDKRAAKEQAPLPSDFPNKHPE